MINGVIWIVAIILFIVLEAATSTVVSIWFAGGGSVALIAAILGAGANTQIFLFLFTSLLLVILLRKVAFKALQGKKADTNLDRIVGSRVLIKEEVNNKLCTGSALIGDVEWKVKSETGDIIAKDETAEVVAIEGVRLIVKK